MTDSYARIFAVAFLSLCLLSACKNTPPSEVRNYPDISETSLVTLIENSKLQFEYFSAKASVDVKAPKQSNSFRATIRIRRDSAIWVSVSPAMGIEVFRILCTRDSVHYIDKLKKEYFRGTYKKLSELAKSELDYEAMQDLLLGDPLYFNPELEYRSRKNGEGYLLATRNSNLLRKITNGRNEDYLIPLDTSGAEYNEKKLQRLQERKDDNELIVRQYWLGYTVEKIVQSTFTDLASALFLTARYSSFQAIDDRQIPSKTVLILGNTKEQATFNLDYSRIKLDEPSEMPFSIPEKYDEIRH